MADPWSGTIQGVSGAAAVVPGAAHWTRLPQSGSLAPIMIEVRQLGQLIGAEVRGVDVKKLDGDCFATMYQAWLNFNVLVVPGQELEIDEFLAYSRRFGRLLAHPSKSTRHPKYPELTMLGVDKWLPDGTLNMAIYLRGAEGWHTDGAYDEVSFKATQLYAVAIPSKGGDTYFASMYAAGAPLSTAAGRAAPPSWMSRHAASHQSFTRSFALILKPAARGSISTPARSCALKGSNSSRAMTSSMSSPSA